jgi:hypothetical protein
MSKLRTFSICLSDIPESAIISHKNGKKYINLVTWDNDEPDKFGNDFSVQIAQSKEERERKEKKVYLGNGKIYKGNESKQENGGKDGLPF